MSRLVAHGVSVDVPRGWDAEIRTLEGADRHDTAVAPPSAPRVVLHAATVALPPVRADYGGDMVHLLGGGGILVVLLEFERASAATALFAAPGPPRSLRAADFSSRQLQHRIGDQTGVQRFFHAAGRAFCLYVVLGSHRRRSFAVPEVNRLLATLVIGP